MRGTPFVARGVGGAIPGTEPGRSRRLDNWSGGAEAVDHAGLHPCQAPARTGCIFRRGVWHQRPPGRARPTPVRRAGSPSLGHENLRQADGNNRRTRSVMRLKRLLALAALCSFGAGAVAAPMAVGAPPTKKPPKCPPGQTAVVTVVGIDLITTCRVL